MDLNIITVIGFNILMMGVLFVLGIYQFMQIDDKKKRHPARRLRSELIVSELNVDEVALRQLVRDERYDDAVQHLMEHGEVDRFTAESAIESLKKQEYRPYYSSDAG